MNINLRLKLSVMMFIEYAIWGSWYVTMGTYLSKTLHFTDVQIGWAYSSTSLAAMVSPFFVGMIADRFFSTERVIAFLHLVGGVTLYLASSMTTFSAFFPMLILHTLCYMPTIALTNSIAFRQMTDPGKQFPGIRVLGTIGWIAIGWVLSGMKIEADSMPFRIGAGVSIALAIFALFLPHTPPASKGKAASIGGVLGLDALRLMKDPSFAVFAVGSALVCIPLTFYYNFTNMFLNELSVKNAAGIMTFGQMSELVFLLIMPLFFARLGVKKMLLIGMLAWAVRYVCFAFGNSGELVALLYAGIILHGVCFDFFFVTGQIYVDKQATDDIRSAAQGFISFITYGVGMYFGSITSGQVAGYFAKGDTHNWQGIWLLPAAGAAVILLMFAFFFKESKNGNGKAASSVGR
jgi:nucleoside transporter